MNRMGKRKLKALAAHAIRVMAKPPDQQEEPGMKLNRKQRRAVAQELRRQKVRA